MSTEKNTSVWPVHKVKCLSKLISSPKKSPRSEISPNELQTAIWSEFEIRPAAAHSVAKSACVVCGGVCGRFACVGHRDFKSLNTRAAVGFACEFTARVDRRAVVGCDSLRARVSRAMQPVYLGVLMHSQCANERHQKFTRGRMNDDFGISCFRPGICCFCFWCGCLFFRAAIALTFNHLKCLQMPATDALRSVCVLLLAGAAAPNFIWCCATITIKIYLHVRGTRRDMGASPHYDNCNIKPLSSAA